MTPELKMQLDAIYTHAIDPNTPDTYASSLRRKARRLLMASGTPPEDWPPWTAEGAHWQTPASRDDPVEYPDGLDPFFIEHLEKCRLKNTPAEARALCRSLGIPPPPWAVR